MKTKIKVTDFKTSVEKLLKDSTTDNYIKVKTIAPDTLLLATRIINIDEACNILIQKHIINLFK